MAFRPGSLAEKYSTAKATSTGNFRPGSLASQIKTRVPKTGKGQYDNPDSLYRLAVNNGLQGQADRILRDQSGESTKKIFSGGFISDIFDVLNAAQYGVVGMLKGKGFMEGVRTRQSFSDKDSLGDKGLPGVIAGTLLDIAVDPLTYIAPATILKKVPGLAKLGTAIKAAVIGRKVTKAIDVGAEAAQGVSKTYEAVEGGTKLGKYLAQKLTWMQGADPVFKETFERGIKNTGISTQGIVDMVKPISKLDKDIASKLLKRDKTDRFIRASLDELKKVLQPDQFETVSRVYGKIDDLGKQAVDLGLLSKKTFEDNIGEYIKNAYIEYELAKSKGIYGMVATAIKGVKKRVAGLTPEKMKELGQIEDPAYLLFKSGVDLARDVENAKMFKTIAERFGTDVAQDGFTKLPSGIRLGALANKYVPNHMAEYLNEIIAPTTNTLQKQLIGNFKFFKVVMNPATHARNMVSNQVLNYWKLGMNPLDPRVIKANAEAAKEIITKTGKWADEARPFGYNLDTFASAEMKGLLDSPDIAGWGSKLGKTWQKAKKTLGGIYQAEENQAKLAAYIFNRTTKNLSPEMAWKAAESATFNYAQVTPFVRKLRESIFGFPFITFTVKSTPVVAETLVKAPQRISVIGKIKQGIENLADLEETERERQNEPSWVKDGFYVKLPMKDKNGRSAYFDLTYILPFGDLMSGNFFEGAVNMETGVREGIPTTLMKKSPFIQLVAEIGKNRDFYGNSIWKDTDSSEKQLGDLMRHITKTYAPPIVSDQIPGGYNEKGERQQRGIIGSLEAGSDNQKRSLMQELLRNVGAKVQPIDADIQETYSEWNRKNALQKLLIENGILDEYTRVYQPK